MSFPVMPPRPAGNADERLVAALKTLGTGALTGIPETANLLASMRDRNTQLDILRRYHGRSQTGQSAAGALGSAVGSRMEEMPGQQLYNAMWDQRRQEMDAAGIPFAGQLGLEIGSPDLTDLGHLAAVLPARLAKKGTRAAEGAARPNPMDSLPEQIRDEPVTQRFREVADSGRYDVRVETLNLDYRDKPIVQSEVDANPANYRFVVHMEPKPAPHWKEHPNGRFVYDDRISELVQKKKGFNKVTLKPSSGYSDSVPFEKDSGYIYRGVSYEEMQFILREGKIESTGSGSFGAQQGQTSYAHDPATAGSYGGNFSSWDRMPSDGRPGYVIKVKTPESRLITDDPKTVLEGYEVGVRGPVAATEIESISEIRPLTNGPGKMEIVPPGPGDRGSVRTSFGVTDPTGWRTGSRSASGWSSVFGKPQTFEEFVASAKAPTHRAAEGATPGDTLATSLPIKGSRADFRFAPDEPYVEIVDDTGRTIGLTGGTVLRGSDLPAGSPGGSLRIDGQHIDSDEMAHARRGHGKRAMKELIDPFLDNDKHVLSSGALSEDSKGVYESLAKDGYVVEVNPTLHKIESGQWATEDGESAYKITHRPTADVFPGSTLATSLPIKGKK